MISARGDNGERHLEHDEQGFGDGCAIGDTASRYSGEEGFRQPANQSVAL